MFRSPIVQALRAAPRDLEFAHRGDRRFGEVTCLTSVPLRGDRSRESSRTGHWPRVTNLRPFFGAESGLLKRIARSRSLCAAHKFQRRRKTLLYNKMHVFRFDHARVRKKCKQRFRNLQNFRKLCRIESQTACHVAGIDYCISRDPNEEEVGNFLKMFLQKCRIYFINIHYNIHI